MDTTLTQRSCQPCSAGTRALQGDRLRDLLESVPEWTRVDGHHLHRSYKFPDFAGALAFVNQIGAIAEQEQHHPDIVLGWGRVEVTTYTHSIAGLSENDFILAAKIEAASRHTPAKTA